VRTGSKFRFVRVKESSNRYSFPLAKSSAIKSGKNMEQLNCYVYKFAHLNANKNTKHWTAETNYYTPHKPFLLLLILDLFAAPTYAPRPTIRPVKT
jgi:hypothetical protein